MNDISADGTEHTFREPNGPGFLHASFSDGAATLGSSTIFDVMSCLYQVLAKASMSKNMRESMTDSEVHFVAQLCRPADLSTKSYHISDKRPLTDILDDWAKVHHRLIWSSATSPDPVITVRMDLGRWSWQWDDFSSAEWPDHRSFGGLVDLSAPEDLHSVGEDIFALANVIERTGRTNGWLKDANHLFDQVARFLVRDASEYQRGSF